MKLLWYWGLKYLVKYSKWETIGDCTFLNLLWNECEGIHKNQIFDMNWILLQHFSTPPSPYVFIIFCFAPVYMKNSDPQTLTFSFNKYNTNQQLQFFFIIQSFVSSNTFIPTMTDTSSWTTRCCLIWSVNMAWDLEDCEFIFVLAVARDKAPFFKHSIVCKHRREQMW